MTDIVGLACAYWDAMDSPANAHGAHVHPIHGRTDQIMGKMWREFGRDETRAAIDTERAKRKGIKA